MYVAGQPVKCRVIRCSPSDERLTLSFKTSGIETRTLPPRPGGVTFKNDGDVDRMRAFEAVQAGAVSEEIERGLWSEDDSGCCA